MNHDMDVNTILPNESLTFLNGKLKEKPLMKLTCLKRLMLLPQTKRFEVK
jgi:hypothetical protein